MKRSHLLLAVSIIAMSFIVIESMVLVKTRASNSKAAAQQASIEKAVLSERVSVQAAGRGNPYINLSDGHELITPYQGAEDLVQALEKNEARGLSLASADFDEDGVPDLISGYSGPSGGIVTLLRGNVDSIYPNAPEAKQRRAEGRVTDAPFLSPAFVFSVPESPDFIGAGDFDGDSHWDVVTAARGSNKLYLLSGDGRGAFASVKQIELPGNVTTMVTGEINRADGLEDVVVGTSGRDVPKVLVFEGPEGALRAKPEIISLPAEATSLALGQLDDDYPRDLAIAAGHELILVHGRDRKLSLDKIGQAEVRQATISAPSFPFAITSVAFGDFTGTHALDMAVLCEDGRVHLLSKGDVERKKKPVSKGIEEWQSEVLAEGSWSQATRLFGARASSNPVDNLVALDLKSNHLQILTKDTQTHQEESLKRIGASPSRGASSLLDVEGQPTAVLPMRLNEDALSDLVILRGSQSAPTVTVTESVSTFIVTKATDTSGIGTLRRAILDANASPGADTIIFNIPGTGVPTISLNDVLPAITDPVTIDGTTQAAGRVELDGTGTGFDKFGLRITAGNSVVRGLIINRFRPCENCGTVISSNNAISLDLNGENLIEGNFIGTDVNGTQAQGNGFGIVIGSSGNVVGGTTTAARNVISGNRSIGISFFPTFSNVSSRDNRLQGNLIGTDVSGALALGNEFYGVAISFGSCCNLIGGTTAGAGNVISNNAFANLFICDSPGNLVQGNFIGTVTGHSVFGNTGVGVSITQAPGNIIGGATVGARNIISGNGGHGIAIGQFVIDPISAQPFIGDTDTTVERNYIGTDVSGTLPLPNNGDGVFVETESVSNIIQENRIAFNNRNGVSIPNVTPQGTNNPGVRIVIISNSIFSNGILGIDLGSSIISNGGLGIDLGVVGVTKNDPRDPDGGANLLQNYPTLISAMFSDGQLRITGNFNSTPNSNFWLDFYGCDECTGANPQGGQRVIGLGLLFHTDANGDAAIDKTFTVSNPGGFINALARDTAGNTSEFCPCTTINGTVCSYSLSTTSQSFPASGGTNSVNVTTDATCNWTAVTNDSFITLISGIDGPGNGALTYSVQANTSTSPRGGTMTIAGQTFTVNQDGASVPCTFSLSSPSQNFTASGGSGTFNVITQGGCNWTAMSDAGWISTGSSGAGNGQVSFFVDTNTSSARTGHITVEGQTFTVTQDGASVPCTYTLSAPSANFAIGGGSGQFNVTCQASCPWTAGSDSTWISTFSSSIGNGVISFTVAANGGPARSGTITVADQSFTVTQDGSACTFMLDRMSQSFAANGGTGGVNVTAASGCTWTAVSNSPFLTINSGASGNGNGPVGYSVNANGGAIIRSGTLTIAGRTFTVYQGIQFTDVPPNNPFYTEIGKLSARGVTLGCGGGNFCPSDFVTREQMSAFIVRALGEFNPPTPASQRFNDVPPSNSFYAFIDRLAALQITLGCSASPPLYCPTSNVTREQMAAFLMRALGEFNPPVPPTQRFNDVPASNIFYNFIDRMAVLQITLGCSASPPLYCPGDAVTRGQMAAFLVRAFNI